MAEPSPGLEPPPQNASAAQMIAPQHVSQHNVAPHLMGFVTNPALATAQGQLFQPPIMMNNPEALMGMPGMFAPQVAPAPTGQAGVPAGAPGVMMRGMATVIGTQAVANGFNGSVQPQPQQQYSFLQPITQNMQQQGQQNMNNNQANTQQTQIANQGYTTHQQSTQSTLGGVPIPALPPHSSTAMQVQVAAAAAAAAAVPLKSMQGKGSIAGQLKSDGKSAVGRTKKSEMTAAEKAKQNRDRNREHARSTRLRKKAYVQKLKELVEGLHAERTEEVRKRRVAIQHLSEVQGVRRAVVRSFLRFHSSYESDQRKWMTILEDDFWLKQPVTPYRSFRRAEVEQECRISRGTEAMIADAASVSVMVESIGSRSSRWIQLKREEILDREDIQPATSHMPRKVDNANSRLQHAVSSLSSSSGSSNSSNGSGGEEYRQKALAAKSNNQIAEKDTVTQTKKVSSSSGSSSESRGKKQHNSNDYHDYHAPALPDPKLGDSEGSSPSDSPEESNNSSNGGETGVLAGTKHSSTDSSSGDEDKISDRAVKRRKVEDEQTNQVSSNGSVAPSNSDSASRSALPPNIAKKGGISHNIRPISTPNGRDGNDRLSLAPAITLPPFIGIGKKAASSAPATESQINPPQSSPTAVAASLPQGQQSSTQQRGPITVSSSSSSGVAFVRPEPGAVSLGEPSVIAPDSGDTSSNSSNNNNNCSSGKTSQIRAYYHMNEDDMLLTEDVLMCPFIFRSQDAVLCGALSECIMPGMLRAQFSQRNKLLSLEMVYDAMGFMQQLERASGTDNLAQVVPGSLEMALAPNAHEARVITLAKSPFLIVSVNEAWTRTTKYTQMEVEGKELSILNGSRANTDTTVRPGKPLHKFEEVARGRCACSTNIHYDKEGREFTDFMTSYPLTNANNAVTHLLHVFKELPVLLSPQHEFP
mmetsp:Transcript_28811/g.44006  ORF Transcript_28811/g.44006 Transcript_28811/m.44006 type:complete len:927 (+) Transcript_28811:189-2969(+)|eukprot:CAMPEP_0194252376 /NCGR_PEP_ID=MMETSP0158-20130606/27434_1 /TAXON_ID=33649 /ORGANISM="Thalassionema nitzschioides, Strain L26-B" /LENGTH=926 /DNA_ID=CAMNT_0038989773 /DNA_START=105 /DNA_END=2885 /DNA_ORIENTATION=-